MTYEDVEQELARGIHPEVLCSTCPWDRLCIKPPMMTKAYVDAKLDAAKAEDLARNPNGKPTTTILAALTYGGRDRMGEMCPVFALRLRSPAGRRLADGIRDTMREWGDHDE